MLEAKMGQPIRRKEDQRFLTGKGQYVDDLKRPNQTYAYILRSQVAHARITKIDTSAAEQMPGVVAIFLGKDVEADKIGTLPCGWLVTGKTGPMVEPPHPMLVSRRRLDPDGRGRHQGPGEGGRAGLRRRLRHAAGRRQHRRGSRRGGAPGVGAGAGEHLLRLGDR
jgi:CO/xanthine dehydrogenase Mo-binding subunit